MAIQVINPCGKCGSQDRNASGKCRVCQRARSAAWSATNAEIEKQRKSDIYQANKEKIKHRSAAWYAANKERASVSSAARYAANPEAKKGAAKAWAKANPERVRLLGLAWRHAHPEKAREISAKWRAANPEKRRKIAAIWRSKNREQMRVRYANRRARVRASGGKLSKGLPQKLYALQKGKCACCGLPLRQRYHLDHINPLALGGANEDWNMQLLRDRCNHQKSARHPIEFMQSRGFLL